MVAMVSPRKPGCTNNTCGLDVINPFADSIFSGDMGEDLLYMPDIKVPRTYLSGCVDSDSYASPLLWPMSPKGFLALQGHSLHYQFRSRPHSICNIPPKFALCLPSSSNKQGTGEIFIGGGPYAPNSVASIPLVISSSDEYFIHIKSINIDDKVVNFTTSLLSLDDKGNGGTKISTMSPYIVLHHSIYKPFVRDFVMKAAARKIKRVASVPPFGACFDAKTIGDSDRGPAVPAINVVLTIEGLYYGIYGHNSMVEMKKNVLCLAFVDGGKGAKTAISISSSLLFHEASCSDPASLNF